ncbi:hypothetical protein [Tenacibaculum finnmarkense]|uniref:hypothetical protein n=1 Tax=Tenacibaculum finnmarkense TaxID=2781243 RepID=UPI000C654D42|nr:hypothetical protein [Tenacibaculum finnmarkense]SOS56039.1 conserved hypothetical protein [Tenacibaculum finnmarkense]
MISELFEENKKAPSETIVRLSKSYYFWQIVLFLFWISIAIWIIFLGSKIFGILLVCLAMYNIKDIFKVFSIIKNNSIQMTLSSKGISLYDGKTLSWNSIKDDKIIVEPDYITSAISEEYLTFKINHNEKKIFINNLDINSLRLEYLLKIYRNRHLNGK